MPFQKGHPGKQPGTKRKSTQLVQDTAARLKCDPFEILCLFAKGDWKRLGYDNECYFVEKPDGQVKMGYTITPDMRLTAAKEAVKYLHAQKRAVEVDMNANITTDQEQVKQLVYWLKTVREIE